MIMFLAHQQHVLNIKQKEVLIERSKKKLVKTMDADIAKLDRLNAILGNGIALYVVTAVGGHK